ncbi:MAG: peptidylprolyl isomerase [Deltaproteobacteria bacterium]|nr:peptidylprolyl isomerase [Deltaproteobacteria bacterium]
MISSSKVKTVAKAALTAFFFAIPLYAVEALAKDTTPKEDPGKEVILRVNGRGFTRENLDIAVNNLMPMTSFHGSISNERLHALRKTAVEGMVNDELVYRAAKEEKMDAGKMDINAEIESLKKNLPKGQTLEKVLKNSKMTMAELREHFRRKLAIKAMSKKKADEFRKTAEETVTEAYMEDYYKKNLDKFKEPEQYHLRSILIKADPAGGQRIWNEAHKKAMDIAKKARGGEDFAKLAIQYSQDANASNGGDMGWAHKGSFLEEIDAAASNMKAGGVSDPVMTLYGYHVLKLEAKKPPVQRKFSELNKENLRKELTEKERKRLDNAWMDGLRTSANIEYLSEDIK